MSTFLEKDGTRLCFGGETVLAALTAEPLKYDGTYPARSPWDKTPLPRKLRLEGYITSTADSAEESIAHRRGILARICAPGGTFRLNVDGREAHLTLGELTLKREAPFSGSTAEHFLLEATVDGGFFRGAEQFCPAEESVTGFSFPLAVTEGMTLGEYGTDCAIRVNNRGDVPVGFTAELSPAGTITTLRLTNTATGQYVHIKHSFTAGDTIRISTLRDSLHVTLDRDGNTYNLSGYAADGSELFLLPVGESVITVGDSGAFGGGLTLCELYTTL